MAYRKRNTQIAIIDDKPFPKAEVLHNHKFNIIELGDIKSIDQIAEYPIVVCDIRGVGKHFGSEFEGAHLIFEIRKAYPDKFLVTYTGAQFDIAYNESLKGVDVSIAKDASTEQWVDALERGVEKVTDPIKRWIRFRSDLMDRGVGAYEVFCLEQGFIKAIESKDETKLKLTNLSDDIRDIVVAFIKYALVPIIKLLAS